MVNDQKWGVPILTGAEILAYNTDFVGADEVNSWDVMFSEKYAGQTAYIIQDMMSVIMLYQGHDANMIEYIGDPDKAAEVVAQARDFMIANKDKVRKFYDAGAEVQQMFINQDIVLAHAWSGPISKLIMDGFPVDMTIPKEGSYGFVYNLNVAQNGPNTDNAYTLLDAILAEPEVGANMTRASGFISTFTGADQYLSELEQRAASFNEDELKGLQFFRAEANDMKYDLVDPAVEEVKAA
ncbi:MAG: extracellular solute-binding protein [Pseudomonadota bacterium]